jgi:hypothetical protein
METAVNSDVSLVFSFTDDEEHSSERLSETFKTIRLSPLLKDLAC